MIMSAELINDNGISAIALAFFTALFGAISAIFVQISKSKTAAREAAKKANEASTKAEAARKNTVNVSNGFAGDVDKKLTVIVNEVQRISKHQDDIAHSLREHLGWHISKEKK